MQELINNVKEWSKAKGLNKKENSKAQLCKLIEEVGEIAQAINKNQSEEMLQDAVGDTMVVLIILAQQNGLYLDECLQSAWNEIKDRTGKTINGTFIKDESTTI